MTKRTIGVIGDFDVTRRAHTATNDGLRHAADALGVDAAIRWVPTPDLERDAAVRDLKAYDGLWASPGSPYKSLEGALRGIRFARERGVPLFGT